MARRGARIPVHRAAGDRRHACRGGADAGLRGAGRSVLPALGQRRLRRRELPDLARLPARPGQDHSDDADLRHGDPGPEQLQPRLSRPEDPLRGRRRDRGRARARRTGADRHAGGADRRWERLRGRGELPRQGRHDHRRRRLAGGLVQHPGRQRRRRRAPRGADLVSGQRLSDRQGDVQVRGAGAARPRGGRQRAPGEAAAARRPIDLDLEGVRADGHLPGDRGHRPVQAAAVAGQRDPLTNGGGPEAVEAVEGPAAQERAHPLAARGAVRAVPVRAGRGDSGRREVDRLRARDTDASRL